MDCCGDGTELLISWSILLAASALLVTGYLIARAVEKRRGGVTVTFNTSCPGCGRLIKAEWTFCPDCGEGLRRTGEKSSSGETDKQTRP